MDMVISWIIFGMMVTFFALFIEGGNSREEIVSSSFSGVSGGILGGAFGEMVANTAIANSWHISPLVFASLGAFLFIFFARDKFRVL